MITFAAYFTVVAVCVVVGAAVTAVSNWVHRHIHLLASFLAVLR